MIRIAHLSDSHFDERGRLADVVAVHQAFLDQVAERQVDLIVHAGDWFERRSTPAERLAVAEFLRQATEVAPVFGVKGNHDQALDLDLFPMLDTAGDNPIAILDRPTATPASAIVWELGRGRDVGLLALPWFDKAHLVAALDATVDAEDSRQRTIASARDLLTCLRAEAARLRAEHIVPILVGHVLVAGSEMSNGQVLIGTTVELAPNDILDVGATYAALGHIHKTQEWFGGRVAYSGSPHRCNFGEPEAKGWRLVTLDDNGTFLSNEFVELPARRIARVERDLLPSVEEHGLWSPDDPLWLLEEPREIQHGDLVRIRYRVRAEDLHLLDTAAITAAARRGGAAEVQLEAVVVAETRVRAGEIRTARTTADKVRAYLQAKGLEIDEATWARLEAKLGEIEAA